MKNARPTAARDRGRYFSRAVAKALEILDLIQDGQRPMSLNEIAKRIHLSKTSTLRLLHTLEGSGALISSGLGHYESTSGAQSVMPPRALGGLLRVATPLLNHLSHELGETISLAALFENRMEVIAVFESPQLIRMSNIVGHIVPPHASSLGKAIIAFQSEERRDKVLRSVGIYRFTSNTITERAELNREFERVRGQQFATDREESVPDGYCFGVPIFTDPGVPAAISTSIPKTRVRDASHERAIIEALTATAASIAAALRTI